MSKINIDHNYYEKIQDTVFWLTKDWNVRFIVILSNNTDKYGKENFHKEFMYGPNSITINRDYKSYMCIECNKKDQNGKKLRLLITQNDIYFLKYKLNKSVSWFTDSNVYAKKEDGTIFIPSKTYNDKLYLSLGDYIEIEPSIALYNNEQIIGTRFYINSDYVNFFVNVNTYLSFVDFINTFNFIQSAQLMLAYIGRPEYGQNIMVFNNSFTSTKNNNTKFLNPMGERKEELKEMCKILG